MDWYSSLVSATWASLGLLFVAVSLFLIKLFTGKAISDPAYAPVVATVLHQLFYFDSLFDYMAGFSPKHATYRVINLTHSELYTVDPHNVEYILKSQFENYSKGEHNRSIMRDLFGDGIFNADGERWRSQRKLASVEFSTRVLRDFSCAIFRRNSAKLSRIVEGFAAQRAPFDIQDLLMKCALDSIFKVGFGEDLDCLGGSSEGGSAFIKAFDESNALTYRRYADVLWKVKRFLNVGSEANLRQNIAVIDEFVYSLIRGKRRRMLDHDDGDSGKEDILSRFLAESRKEPEKITDKYLRDIILNFIIAGKDTTANTLCWFFYMLCKHPSIQEKISQQIRDVVAADQTDTADDVASKSTDGILEKMHYLHATLTETLRLYPAVPIDGKNAEVDDVLPDGFRVRKGDGINYMAYAMGRMKHVWGEDAEEFRPERWLEDGIFRPESPFRFVAFHAGPRICLGKEFAYRQMKIISMVLLYFFKFQLQDRTEELRYKTMFTLHVDGGLHLRAFPRLNAAAKSG